MPLEAVSQDLKSAVTLPPAELLTWASRVTEPLPKVVTLPVQLVAGLVPSTLGVLGVTV